MLKTETRNRTLMVLVISTGLFMLLAADSPHGRTAAPASPHPSTSASAEMMLWGNIRAANGKPLEGIVVSARNAERTFTTNVFTDEEGNYFFPALDQGRYRIWAQAVGFEMARTELSLDPSKETRQDFTLNALDDFTMQLSGAEWMQALPSKTPEDRRMKEVFQHNCAACHTQSFLLQNRFDRTGWLAMLSAMENIMYFRYDSRPDPVKGEIPLANIHHFKEELADYLAKMRGPDASPMKFHPLPRPTGDAARAVITEYDIPPAETPGQLAVMDGSDWSEGTAADYGNVGTHDMAVDFHGNAWFTTYHPNRVRSYGKIDPKTGEITDYKVEWKNGWVRNVHSVLTGPDGVIWAPIVGRDAEMSDPAATASMGLGRIDPETEKLEIFSPPSGMHAAGQFVAVDGKGKVWTVTSAGALRFDPDTKKFTEFVSPSLNTPLFSTYGLAADIDGKGWWSVISEDKLGIGDPTTGKSQEIKLAPRSEMREFTTEEDRRFYERTDNLGPQSINTSAPWDRTPRRLGADPSEPYVWAADFYGQDLARVNIRTLEVKYYDLPIPYASPYGVKVGKNHVVWTALRNADRVGSFDPSTNKWTVYQLPTVGSECRDITIDEKTGDVWLPSWRTSKAFRLQFRTEQQLSAAHAKITAANAK
jgi:streptogramin lyase